MSIFTKTVSDSWGFTESLIGRFGPQKFSTPYTFADSLTLLKLPIKISDSWTFSEQLVRQGTLRFTLTDTLAFNGTLTLRRFEFSLIDSLAFNTLLTVRQLGFQLVDNLIFSDSAPKILTNHNRFIDNVPILDQLTIIDQPKNFLLFDNLIFTHNLNNYFLDLSNELLFDDLLERIGSSSSVTTPLTFTGVLTGGRVKKLTNIFTLVDNICLEINITSGLFSQFNLVDYIHFFFPNPADPRNNPNPLPPPPGGINFQTVYNKRLVQTLLFLERFTSPNEADPRCFSIVETPSVNLTISDSIDIIFGKRGLNDDLTLEDILSFSKGYGLTDSFTINDVGYGVPSKNLKWWNRGDSTFATSIGSTLTPWVNNGSSGVNAPQPASGSRPTVQDGPRHLEFDGINDYYVQNSSNLSLTTAFSVFVVFRLDKVTGIQNLWTFGQAIAGGENIILRVNGDILEGRVSDGQPWIIGTTVLTTNTLYAAYLTYHDSSSPKSNLYLNNNLEQTQDLTGTLAGATLYLASRYVGGASDFLDGGLYETLCYNEELTGTKMTNVKDYLNSKYTLW